MTHGERLVEAWRTRATRTWIKDRPPVFMPGSLCFPETQSLAEEIETVFAELRKAVSRCICEGLPWCDACKQALVVIRQFGEPPTFREGR